MEIHMRNVFTKTAVCLAIALQPFAGFAGSVAGTGGATEVTQLLNNAQLIQVQADGAITAAKQIQAYIVQIQQYQTQLLNLQALAGLPAGLVSDVMSQIKTF